MARPLRIEYERGLYHVTARGNERRNIFRDEKDFDKLVEILERYVGRFGVKIHCYVLMSNHYHLLIETPGANLTSFMHNVQSHYTNYFNRRHGRAGHLFQGRYKALIVDKETYMLELSRYIHLNPVRAGLVELPQNWTWSSFAEYIATTPSGNKWIETEDILKYFGKRRKSAVKKYVEYVLVGVSKEHENPFGNVTAQLILGPEAFVEKVRELISGDGKKMDSEIVSGRELSRWTPRQAERAISKIADTLSLKENEILKKGAHGNRGRQAAIMVFHSHSRWTVTEIGEIFRISGSAVSKAVNRLNEEMKKDDRLAKEVQSVLSIFSA